MKEYELPRIDLKICNKLWGTYEEKESLFQTSCYIFYDFKASKYFIDEFNYSILKEKIVRIVIDFIEGEIFVQENTYGYGYTTIFNHNFHIKKGEQ